MKTASETDAMERFHDNCDCIAVASVEGKNWEGKAQADELYKHWKKATWHHDDQGHPTAPADHQLINWTDYVKDGGLKKVSISPLAD